jgi:branched-chain amino acid transport system ATP-binding protein
MSCFAKGLLRTFQIAHEFTSMTCRENLMMVPAGQSGESLWNTWFGRARIAEEERALRAKADEVLEFLTIEHLADHPAGMVSGGQKKLLELGRTMMVDAKDRLPRRGRRGREPDASEHHRRRDPAAEQGPRLHLLHDRARHGFHRRLCDPVIVMAEGKVLAEGTIDEIKANEQVIEAYLGTGLKNKDKAGGGGMTAREVTLR